MITQEYNVTVSLYFWNVFNKKMTFEFEHLMSGVEIYLHNKQRFFTFCPQKCSADHLLNQVKMQLVVVKPGEPVLSTYV